MPAAKHPMEEAVKELVANYPTWGPERIRERMERAATRGGVSLADLPSLATIGRTKARLNDAERLPYMLVRFPESFGNVLPWESAPVVGELLRAMLGKTPPERPTIRLARAVWELSLIRPDMDLARLEWLGQWLAYAEALPLERATTLRREVESEALGIEMPEWRELRRANLHPFHPLTGLHATDSREAKAHGG